MTTYASKILVGRDSEISRLSALLNEATDGRGKVAMITGEAGIGKTRLVTELATLATKRKATIATGRVREIAGAPPYWPWIQILATLLGDDSPEIVQLRAENVEESTGNQSDAARFQLFDAISISLKKRAEQSPLVVVLENLHWADSSSLHLLEFLAFDINSTAIMFVGTNRDTDVTADHPISMFMGAMSGDPNFTHLPLIGLDKNAIGELFRVTSSITPSSELVDAVFASSQGNALFTTETIRLLNRAGKLTPENLANTTNWNIGVPDEIRGVLARRLAGLASPTTELLRIAAVLGREFTTSLLSAVAGIEPTDILQAFDEPVASGILVEDQLTGTDFRFSHALFRQVLLDDLSPSRRTEFHAATANAIEVNPDLSDESNAGPLAYHYREAIPLTGTPKAVEYALRAGNQAIQILAYESAEDWFRQALDHLGDSPQTDRWAEASAGLARSLPSTTTGSERSSIGIHTKNAWDYYIANGRLDEALELAALPLPGGEQAKLVHLDIAQRAIELVDPTSKLAGYLQVNLCNGTLFKTGNFKQATEHLDAALNIADTLNDTALKSTALKSLVTARHFHGAHESDDMEVIHQAILAARSANNPAMEAECAMNAAWLSVQSGDGPGSILLGEQALKAAERSRNRQSIVYTRLALAGSHEAVGDTKQSLDILDEAAKLQPDNSAVLAQRIMLEESMGRSEDADRHIEELRGHVLNPVEHFDEINLGLSLVSTSSRKPENIEPALSIAEQQILRTNVPGRVIAQGFQILGHVACELDSIILAQRVVDNYEANPDLMKSDAAADLLFGCTLSLVGRKDEGIERLERLYSMVLEANYPLYTGLFGHSLALALISRATSEDAKRAANLLQASTELIRDHGYHGLTKRVVDAQTLLTERTGRTARADGLTKRELEILALVAAGNNNPDIAEKLFISRHTVVSHLSNIFEKIQVENRAQATAYATVNNLT